MSTAIQKNKLKRKQLINTLGNLEEIHCKSCPKQQINVSNTTSPASICGNCSVFTQIRQIGEELNVISNENRIANMPKELTLSTFLALRENEIGLDDIRMHFNITKYDFDDFMTFNNLRKPRANSKFKHLTPQLYLDWMKKGKSEKHFCEQYNISRVSLRNFKNFHNIKEVTIMGKSVSKQKTINKKSVKPVVAETENTEKQKEMPTIDTTFDFSESVNQYFESRSEKSAELKAQNIDMASTAKQPSVEEVKILESQYEIDRLNRELELQKELRAKAEHELALYRYDYSNVTDEREQFKNRLDKLLPEMEDLQTMNLIFMKKMISLDHVLKERGI